MNDFQFQIGEFVRHVVSQNQSSLGLRQSWDKTPHHEVRGIVQGRIAEECAAGVQRHYLVRWVRDDGAILHDACMRHHEIELCRSEPFPANKES